MARVTLLLCLVLIKSQAKNATEIDQDSRRCSVNHNLPSKALSYINESFWRGPQLTHIQFQ